MIHMVRIGDIEYYYARKEHMVAATKAFDKYDNNGLNLVQFASFVLNVKQDVILKNRYSNRMLIQNFMEQAENEDS